MPLALLILMIWFSASVTVAFLWCAFYGGHFADCGYFFRELGGALLDIGCQLYLDIIERLPWRKKKRIKLDEFEKELS